MCSHLLGMRWGARQMSLLLLMHVPKQRILSKQVWTWPQHMDCSASLTRRSNKLLSSFLPPLCPQQVAVSDGSTTATALHFPLLKRSLPQRLKRSSLKAVIKNWSKSWCPAPAPKLPKCCSLRSLVRYVFTAVSDTACARDSLLEPGLGKTS